MTAERSTLLASRLAAIAKRELDDRTLDPGDAHNLLDLIEAAEEFVRSTSFYRQRKVSRDSFERLAAALIEIGVLRG